MARLCDELDNTTSLLDLLLGLGADIAGADDDGDGGKTALSEDLGVAEVEEVEDGSVTTLLGEVLIALLGGDQGPELVEVDDGLPELVLELVDCFQLTRDFEVVRVRRLYSIACRPFRSNRDGTYRCWSCGDADHRPYHDHRGASSARLSVSVPRRFESGATNVLADTTVTGGNVAAMLAGLGQSVRS